MEAPPEFQFLVQCCLGSLEAERRTLSASVQWPLFLRLARFHRVQGLLWNAIRSVDGIPPFARAELSADAAAITASNLRSAAECKRLAQLFENAGIEFLFVKGLTLAMLVYGTITTKAGVDIDLLIDPAQLKEAADVLREAGYRLAQPAAPRSDGQLGKWHRHRKESTWRGIDSDLQVDLHTRLADNPSLIAGIGLQSPRQMVEVSPGISLPTLATDELFAYLAVHGASSAWFRLKWITDFAALIAGQSSEETNRLYLMSQRLGAGRAAGQALLLADILYGSLSRAEALKTKLERDNGVRWLARIALNQVSGPPVEPTSRLLGTAAIHYSQLLLLPGQRFKLTEAMRQGRAMFA